MCIDQLNMHAYIWRDCSIKYLYFSVFGKKTFTALAPSIIGEWLVFMKIYRSQWNDAQWAKTRKKYIIWWNNVNVLFPQRLKSMLLKKFHPSAGLFQTALFEKNFQKKMILVWNNCATNKLPVKIIYLDNLMLAPMDYAMKMLA